jgi:hypothetical protein
MRDCTQEQNKAHCNCTYEPCDRKGICCECLRYHWRLGELPACLFPDELEKTYDRSIERFVESCQAKRRR